MRQTLFTLGLPILLLSAVPILADEMQYSYTASGAPSSPTSFVTYTGQSSAVSGTTVAGSAMDLKLGTFTVSQPPSSNQDNNPNDVPFTLTVTFTAPPGISGGQGQDYSMTLNGTIKHGTGNSGDLDITFGPPPSQSFTYNNGVVEGSFDFGIEITSDVDGTTGSVPAATAAGGLFGINWENLLSPGSTYHSEAISTTSSSATYQLLGYISNAFQQNVPIDVATPEPASFVLLGSVLAGLVWYRRRKST